LGGLRCCSRNVRHRLLSPLWMLFAVSSRALSSSGSSSAFPCRFSPETTPARGLFRHFAGGDIIDRCWLLGCPNAKRPVQRRSLGSPHGSDRRNGASVYASKLLSHCSMACSARVMRTGADRRRASQPSTDLGRFVLVNLTHSAAGPAAALLYATVPRRARWPLRSAPRDGAHGLLSARSPRAVGRLSARRA
jgi:hypothetical protein